MNNLNGAPSKAKWLCLPTSGITESFFSKQAAGGDLDSITTPVHSLLIQMFQPIEAVYFFVLPGS